MQQPLDSKRLATPSTEYRARNYCCTVGALETKNYARIIEVGITFFSRLPRMCKAWIPECVTARYYLAIFDEPMEPSAASPVPFRVVGSPCRRKKSATWQLFIDSHLYCTPSHPPPTYVCATAVCIGRAF